MDRFIFNTQFIESEDAKKRYKHEDEQGSFRWDNVGAPGKSGYFYDLGFGEKMPKNGYRMPKETALQMIEEGKLKLKKGVVPEQKRYIKNDA